MAAPRGFLCLLPPEQFTPVCPSELHPVLSSLILPPDPVKSLLLLEASNRPLLPALEIIQSESIFAHGLSYLRTFLSVATCSAG